MGIAYQGITIKLIGWLVWYDNISLQFRGPYNSLTSYWENTYTYING